MTKSELIAALEGAPGPSAELFYDAGKIVFGVPNASNERTWLRFGRCVHAEAWVDAAIMLAPEGCPWEIKSIGIVEIGTGNGPVEGIAAIPANAFLVAALRATERVLEAEGA